MSCATVVKKNIGIERCLEFPQMPRTIVTLPVGFSCTPAEAIDVAFWQAKLLAPLAERVYVWDYFVKHEDNSEDAVYDDTPHALIPVRDGNYRFRFDFRVGLCKHKAMYTHRASSGGVFIFDSARKNLGTVDSNDNIRGLDIQLLHTEKIKFADGSVGSTSPILLALNDNKQVDESGVLFDFSFISELIRLTDAIITVVSATSALITVTVTAECDGTPINGLIAADFRVFEPDGSTVQVLGVVTETIPTTGTYTIAPDSAFVTGVVALVAAAALSVVGYEAAPVTTGVIA